MNMTRKDFEAVAKIIHDTSETREESATHLLLFELSKYFSTVNPAFDHQRFVKAGTKTATDSKDQSASSWSERYFSGLSSKEHADNNSWFDQARSVLKEDGILFVPVIGLSFNKRGEPCRPLE